MFVRNVSLPSVQLFVEVCIWIEVPSGSAASAYPPSLPIVSGFVVYKMISKLSENKRIVSI